MSYAKKRIDVTITLGKGQFGDTPGDEVTLSGLRVSANTMIYNGDMQGQLQLRVWGMTMPLINQLTRIGHVQNQHRANNIVVTAGEEGGSMATVFEGSIETAYGDFAGVPEVVFNVFARSVGIMSVKPSKPRSYPVAVAVADVMEDLAKEMGSTFEKNDVIEMLPAGTYFSGSAMDQVKACARSAAINFTADRGKLAIWSRNGYRRSTPIKVSAATGMVGYPAFSSNGIVLTTLFNADFETGGRALVESDIPVACGLWNIARVAHSIESEVPDGAWFSQITGQVNVP